MNDKYSQRQLNRLQSAGKAALSAENLKNLRGAKLHKLDMKQSVHMYERSPIHDCDPEFREVIESVFQSYAMKALEESISYLEECAGLAVSEHQR